MTTRAAQIECLLAPVIDYRTNSIASGYTVYFYAAGTSTPKNAWTEKEKTNPYTSRTLGSDGTIQVYGDGVYRIIVKDTDGTTVYDWDNIKVQANTFTVQDKSDDYTATAEDDLVLVDTTSDNVTINIADVADFTHPLIVKHRAGANNVTVDPYSTQPIDGNSTITLTPTDDSAVLYPLASSAAWYRADRLSGVTATVNDLNRISGGYLHDDDDDTRIYVEKSADEDKIRCDTGGTERSVLDSTGLSLTVPIVSPTINTPTITTPTISTPTISGNVTLDGNTDFIVTSVTSASRHYLTLTTSGGSSINIYGASDATYPSQIRAEVSGGGGVVVNADGTLNITDGIQLAGNDIDGIRGPDNSDGTPTIRSTAFDIATNIGTGTWESVGATGSGATNIWTALNFVPSSAKWVEIAVVLFGSDGAASTDLYAVVAARNGGSSASYAEYDEIATIGDRSDGSGQAYARGIFTRKVQVSSRIMDLYWLDGGFTNKTANAYLVAWGD